MSKSITLDARKVIKYMNDSAQSQINVISEALHRLGDKVGQKYSLVALHPKNVMFEDADGQYYIADYAKSKGSRVNFSKVTKVNIEESKKSHVFNNACVDLVESISKSDEKSSEIAFRKLESCRFRSTVASSDGLVTTKDGKRRKFIMESDAIAEDSVKLIVEAVSKAMQENVIIEDNQVVGGKVGDIDLKLPITETTRRCNVAKKMKSVAEDAWKSSKFQKFLGNVAGMVSKNLIKEAVAESAKFLKEYQEFSLLNLLEMETLIENTLALANQYNPVLVENTALLVYKTNTKANKEDILNAWEKTARVASDPALLEDVFNLSRSEDFNNDYQEFLYKVIVEETKVPEEFLTKFLMVIKKLLKEEIEQLRGSAEEQQGADETSATINDLLTGEGGEAEMAMEGKKPGTILEQEDPILAKYEKALNDVEDMISGVNAGDPDQVEAATNMINAIDVEDMMNADTLSTLGQEPEIGDIGAGDVANAAEEVGEGEEMDLGAELGGEELGGDLGLGGEGDLGELGGEMAPEGELGPEGELAPEEGEGEEEIIGLEEEGEEGDEEEEMLMAADVNKDAYADYTLAEDQEIDDDYGTAAEAEEKNEEEQISEAMDDVVSDLRSLFESGEKPWEQEEEVEKDDKDVIKEEDPEGGADEEEGEEKDEGDSDKPFPGAAPAFGEGKEDIKNKDVISGTEGVKAAEGAPEDSMPKDLGGKIPGKQTLEKGCGCTDHKEPGNKGSDSDCKEVGGKDPIKRKPKNDDSTAILKEDKAKTPTFGKGPFKRVK